MNQHNRSILSETSIVSKLGEKLERTLVNKTVRYMQGFKDCLQSGDDSGLKNLWDEYCVQVQFQDSYNRGTYDLMIHSFISDAVDKLSEMEVTALWLQTDKGFDWSLEDEESRDPSPAIHLEVIDHLVQAVNGVAADWTNSRISRYLNNTEPDYYE